MFKKAKGLKTSNKSFKFTSKTSKPKQPKYMTKWGAKNKQKKQMKIGAAPKQPMTQAHRIGPHKRQEYLTAKPKQPKFYSEKEFMARLHKATT